MVSKVEAFYDKHYKVLLMIPLALLVASLGILGYNYAARGELIGRDVELQGGVEVTIDQPGISVDAVESVLREQYEEFSARELTDFSSHKNLGVTIKMGELGEEEIPELKELLQKKFGFQDEQFSSAVTRAEFGSSFYKSLLIVVVFAFLLMAVSVVIAFRTLIPSVAVILAAFTDIVVALAVISLLDVKLTAGGIVAFLLVIGYSIDTDVLLTTWMIKRREGSYLERMVRSIKTGVTMTMTTLLVLAIGIFIAISPVLHQMFLIILIALLTDIIVTYLGNAPILIWYCKKKGIT